MKRKMLRALPMLLLLPCLACTQNGDSGEPDPADSADTVTQDAPGDTVADAGDAGIDTAVEDTGPNCPEPGTTDRPPGLSEAYGVMDPQRRKLVFFGGNAGVPVNCQTATDHLDEFWVYDTICGTFEKVETAGGPGPRARGMAVYDSDRDQMVIFGGRYRAAATGPYTVYDEVWALDLASYTWNQIQTKGAGPAPRSNPAGGYNQLKGEMVVFGGNLSHQGISFEPMNDVWALDLEAHSWRQIVPQGSVPEARLFHASAVDAENNRLYVYGGGDANAWTGPFLGDLYAMDLETGSWELLHDGKIGAPMGRIWSTLTWDKVGQRLLLFGGHDDGALGNNNDTWSFDPTTKAWTTLTEPEEIYKPSNGFCDFPKDFTFPNMDAPERRSAQIAALDEIRGEWVIFGGKTDCGLIDDVWLFLLGQDAWAPLIDAQVGETCTRGDQPQLCVALCK